MKRLFVPLGAGFAVATTIGPASAQVAPTQIVSDVGVRYGDLDLESAPGARTMLARLNAAAAKACGGKPTPAIPGDQVGLAKQREYRRCKAAAMDSSTLRLGSPLVRAAWLNPGPPSATQPREAVGMAQADAQLSKP